MMKLHLMALTGKFNCLRIEKVASRTAALELATAHAASGNFTHVKEVEEDLCSIRYTARTPGGRGGRNVAFLDLE